MKKCSGCKLLKDEVEFVKNKSSKDGLHHSCKSCHNARCRAWTEKNLDRRREIGREGMSRLIERDPERVKKTGLRYYNRCTNDPVKLEKRRAKNRRSYVNNREKRIAKVRKYENMRMLTDPAFKLAKRVKTRVRSLLRGADGSSSTEELIGCSRKHLVYYLERKFQPGMTLENYGTYGWHMDHIMPCASFDLNDFEQQRACFHFSNLQPLWAKDNLSKGKKIL